MVIWLMWLCSVSEREEVGSGGWCYVGGGRRGVLVEGKRTILSGGVFQVEG